MEGSARGLGAGQEKGALSSCLVGRGGTFRTGQRLLAQGAEAEVLVEAPGLGLFQHLWAPIHSMQLEEAPSLQLRWRRGKLSHSSHLSSLSWVPASREGSGPTVNYSPNVWEQ